MTETSSPSEPSTSRVAHAGALGDLLRFHGQIRSALLRLDELTTAAQLGIHQPDEARALIAFLRGPLIWHDVDEETSVLPRLRQAQLNAQQQEALEQVHHQHEAMEDTIENIIPMLLATCMEPPPAVNDLSKLATQLRLILEPHLAHEEKHVFPLAQLVLDEEARQRIGEEIAGRQKNRLAGKSNAVALD